MANRMVREAVAVFHDPAGLQGAVDDLLVAGFDRSQLSLMASCRTIERQRGRLHETIAEIEDDPTVPRVAFVGCDSRTEGMGAAAAGLAYIGAVAAAGAIAATGGTLALAIGAAALSGGGGLALGALAARYLGTRHAHNLQEQLARGGILLWVEAPTPDREAKACTILARNGAEDVHVHDLPIADATLHGGVSRDMTWLGKPLRSVLGLPPAGGTAPPRPRV